MSGECEVVTRRATVVEAELPSVRATALTTATIVATRLAGFMALARRATPATRSNDPALTRTLQTQDETGRTPRIMHVECWGRDSRPACDVN